MVEDARALSVAGVAAEGGTGDVHAFERFFVALLDRHVEDQRAIEGHRQPAVLGDLALELPGTPAAATKGEERAAWGRAKGHCLQYVERRRQAEFFGDLIGIAA